MNINYSEYLNCLKIGLSYVPSTLLLALATLLAGIIFGGGIAVVRVFKVKGFSQILAIFIAVMKAIPTNLIMIISNLLLTNYFDEIMENMHLNFHVKDINMIYLAGFALMISSISALSESIRGALMSVPEAQYEAGYSVGLTKRQTFFRIIAPQAFLVLLPSLTGDIITLIKMTSLASLVGVMDILNGSIKYANTSYCFLEAYLAAATIYWGLSIILGIIGKTYEGKVGKYRELI